MFVSVVAVGTLYREIFMAYILERVGRALSSYTNVLLLSAGKVDKIFLFSLCV